MEFHTYETVPNAFHPNETHLPSFILIATPRHLFCLCGTSFNANETPTETVLRACTTLINERALKLMWQCILHFITD